MEKNFKEGDQALLKVTLHYIGTDNTGFDYTCANGGENSATCLQENLIHAPEYKQGQLVEVSHCGNRDGYAKRIYLFSHANRHYCVKRQFESKYHGGEDIEDSIISFDNIRKIPEEVTIEVTCTVNGKNVPLDTLSEESLLKIRKG